MSKKTPPPFKDVELMNLLTPSKTGVLSKEDVRKSKNLRDTNIEFLKQYIRNHQISISQASDHFFFEQMEASNPIFDALMKDYFSPGNQEEPTYHDNLKAITEKSKNFIDVLKNPTKKRPPKLGVFQSRLSKEMTPQKIGAKEILSLHSEEEHFWLNTRIFDAYLQNILVPDVSRTFKFHNVFYVSDHIMRILVNDDISNHANFTYTNWMKRLLLKNVAIDLDKDDIYFFGGHNNSNHFFLLLMIPRYKEFMIIDPSESDTAIECSAKVINIMVPHLNWLKDARKDIKIIEAALNDNSECQMHHLEMDSTWLEFFDVYVLKSGTEIMPRQNDAKNCGLFAMMLCESYMRGYLPNFTADHLNSIRDHCHLESSMASGIPLLGKQSVYCPLAWERNGTHLSKWQKEIQKLIPEPLRFGNDNWQALKSHPEIGRVVFPISDESIRFHHQPYALPGRKLFMKTAEDSLFLAYHYICYMFYEALGKKRKCKTMAKLKQLLYNWIEKRAYVRLDAAENGINDEYSTAEGQVVHPNMVASLKPFGIYNINVYSEDTLVTEEETNQKVEIALNRSTEIQIGNSLDVTFLFHFALCHVLQRSNKDKEDVDLVVYTYDKRSGKMTTQVFSSSILEIAFYDECKQLSLDTHPYQLLVHQPDNNDVSWKYDVLVLDPTDLMTKIEADAEKKKGLKLRYEEMQYARYYYPKDPNLLNSYEEIGLKDYQRINVSGDGNCMWYSFAVFLHRIGKLDEDCKRCATLINKVKRRVLVHLKNKMGVAFFRTDQKNIDASKQQLLGSMGCYTKALEEDFNRNAFMNNTKFNGEPKKIDSEDYDAFDEDNVNGSRIPDDQWWYLWAFCNCFDLSLVIYSEKFTYILQSNLEAEDVGAVDGVQPQDFSKYPQQISLLEEGRHYEPVLPPNATKKKKKM